MTRSCASTASPVGDSPKTTRTSCAGSASATDRVGRLRGAGGRRGPQRQRGGHLGDHRAGRRGVRLAPDLGCHRRRPHRAPSASHLAGAPAAGRVSPRLGHGSLLASTMRGPWPVELVVSSDSPGPRSGPRPTDRIGGPSDKRWLLHYPGAMSAEAELYVREHSPFRGATFVVHRALAEMAYPDNGWAVWIDPARLASCWRLGERTVDRGRAELTKAGFLTRLDQPRWFRFEFPGALRQGGEDQARQGGEAPSPPRPPLPSTVVSNSSSKEKKNKDARAGS